jgi:hypothetical protein
VLLAGHGIFNEGTRFTEHPALDWADKRQRVPNQNNGTLSRKVTKARICPTPHVFSSYVAPAFLDSSTLIRVV